MNQLPDFPNPSHRNSQKIHGASNAPRIPWWNPFPPTSQKLQGKTMTLVTPPWKNSLAEGPGVNSKLLSMNPIISRVALKFGFLYQHVKTSPFHLGLFSRFKLTGFDRFWSPETFGQSSWAAFFRMEDAEMRKVLSRKLVNRKLLSTQGAMENRTKLWWKGLYYSYTFTAVVVRSLDHFRPTLSIFCWLCTRRFDSCSSIPP